MPDTYSDVWYSVTEDHGSDETPDRHYYRARGPRVLWHLAELCADDYHGNHDGWEASWPRTFVLYATEDGPAIGTFEVDRESVPTFSASAKE